MHPKRNLLRGWVAVLCSAAAVSISLEVMAQSTQAMEELPDLIYMPVVVQDFEAIYDSDRKQKSQVMRSREILLRERYELDNDASDTMMSGERKAVQRGVRVRLPDGVSWQSLAMMSADEIREKNLFPMGFRPLPHAKHATGGMVFPQDQIDAIQEAETRNLKRFDVEFDLPDHLTPEYPPPLCLSSRPDLGDVTQGEVLTIKNYYRLLKGKVTPVQMEGVRLLLTAMLHVHERCESDQIL